MGLGRGTEGLLGSGLAEEGLRRVALVYSIVPSKLTYAFDADGMGCHGGDVIVEPASRCPTVSFVI